MPRQKKQPHQLGPVFADPDIVDRIFEYIAEQFPEHFGVHLKPDCLVGLKNAMRAEFAGLNFYVQRMSPVDRQQRVAEVLRLFNGRNATEVARSLQISRASVYRMLKQPGRP